MRTFLNSNCIRRSQPSLRSFLIRRTDAVASHAEVALELPLTAISVHQLLLGQRRQMTNDNSKTAVELYCDLTLLLSDGDLDGSLAILDQICRFHEDHGGAWELRGLLEAKAGRPNLSVQYLERASILTSLEIWSARTLAIQYTAIGRKNDAAEVLHCLGISGRLETGMLRVVARDLLKLNRPELSAIVIWDAVKADPDNALLWHALSAIQSVLGESPETCLQSVERAIELAPSATEFRVTAATIMIRMDQIKEAYDTVRQVVTPQRVDLDCPCCLWRLICIFESFDDHERMAVCYDRLSGIEAGETFQ